MGSDPFGGGGQGGGYGNENHYAGNGWNQGADQGMGWNPSMANNANVDHGQGCNQEYSTSYPIYGQQPLQQQQQQQQPSQQQPNYEGYGPDFGQNYAQGQGGGAVKGGGFGGAGVDRRLMLIKITENEWLLRGDPLFPHRIG